MEPLLKRFLHKTKQFLVGDVFPLDLLSHHHYPPGVGDPGVGPEQDDRVVFLADQGVCEEGTPEEIFDHPANPKTQRFLYRSRVFERELTPDTLDLYALSSEMRAFLRRYETEKRQERFLPVLCDELLYPVLMHPDYPAGSAFLRLLCSETSSRHTLFIRFRGIACDPLSEPYLDELNLTLLDKFTEFIFSSCKEDGWEVCIQMKTYKGRRNECDGSSFYLARCGGSVFWEVAPFPGNLRSFFCPEYSAHPLNLLFHIFRRNKKYKNAHETVDLKHFVGTYIFMASHETTRYANYVGKWQSRNPTKY